MNARSLFRASPLVAVIALAPLRAAKPASDIAPPDQRRAVVQTAERLARPIDIPPLPADLPQPFAPPGFDRPDPSAAPAPGAAAGPAASAPAPAGHPGAGTGADSQVSDRDLLATVAAKIPTTGTIILGGKPLLVSGVNRIEVGSHFTVVYNGQEYELELVAIERTTFTVRYKGEEFTRPIKLAKSP